MSVFDSCEERPGHDASAIKLAGGDLAAVAKAKEEEHKQKLLQMRHWVCAHCVKFASFPHYEDRHKQIKQHLVNV